MMNLRLLAVMLLAISLAASQRPVKQMCTLPIQGDIEMALHARFATTYYASQFPQIQWTHKFVTSNELTAKNFVKAWVLNGTTCDLVVGPGYSFVATAMSPLVEIPWIDSTSTSTELSDKDNHPSFSRVIPTDEVGAKAAAVVYEKFGWKQTNMLCSDEAYGRSVAAGVSSALKALGGGVETSRCLEASAGPEKVREVLEALMASPVRVVFVAGFPFQPWFAHFLTIAAELEATKKLIFFFSEAFCSSADRTYLQLEGALCATYSGSDAVMAPFLTSYRARDLTQETAELADLGFPFDQSTFTGSNIYAIFQHDAAYHGMSALHSYHANTTVDKSKVKEIQYLREHVSTAATGRIALESNGDRLVVDAVVYNAYQGGVEKKVGTIANQQFMYDLSQETNPAATQANMTFLRRAGQGIPSEMSDTAAASSSSSSSTVLLIAVVVPVVLLCIIVVAAVMGKSKSEQRDNSCAPVDAFKPFTIVFTDIQSSTALWAREPEKMSEAVAIHHSSIRKLVNKHAGYEVKTIGDSFMVAFKETRPALAFALDVQSSLYNTSWGGDQVDQTYREMLIEAGEPVPIEYEKHWNGLRVRIGIHYGEGNIEKDPVTLGYDYYGTVVNIAARVEAAGHGGQVLCTDDFLRVVGDTTWFVAKDLGVQPLRGLDEGVRLHQLRYPNEFQGREFPPLRLDRDVSMDDDAGSEASTARSMQSKMSAQSVSNHLQVQAYRMLKQQHPGMSQAQLALQCERLLEFQLFAKTLLSTSKEAWRVDTLDHLGESWRVNVASKSKLNSSSKSYESAILEVTSKALHATATKITSHSENPTVGHVIGLRGSMSVAEHELQVGSVSGEEQVWAKGLNSSGTTTEATLPGAIVAVNTDNGEGDKDVEEETRR